MRLEGCLFDIINIIDSRIYLLQYIRSSPHKPKFTLKAFQEFYMKFVLVPAVKAANMAGSFEIFTTLTLQGHNLILLKPMSILSLMKGVSLIGIAWADSEGGGGPP